MPKTKSKRVVEINATDLEYAVGRLIAAGKTTKAEVVRLAAERTERIRTLEAELAALRGGKVLAAVPVKPPVKRTVWPKVVKRTTVAKAALVANVGKVITRSDGRTFTTTQKVIDARRAQGQYLAFLRQVPAKEKSRFQAIAKEKGVPTAVVELRKRLGKTGTSAKVAKPAPAVAPVAKPKKKALPANYYRCAHPGCKKNWFVRGRPYCGEHAKLHAKAKSKK